MKLVKLSDTNLVMVVHCLFDQTDCSRCCCWHRKVESFFSVVSSKQVAFVDWSRFSHSCTSCRGYGRETLRIGQSVDNLIVWRA